MRSASAARNGDRREGRDFPVTKPVVLIPAFRPGPALSSLVSELSATPEIGPIVVVDDGSGVEFQPIFRAIAQRATILTHDSNLGKGAALKTGLDYIWSNHAGAVGVVTADADGQHSAQDVVRIASALAGAPNEVVIGARLMDSTVPMRSRFGNRVTRWVMRLLAGQALSDTQTGLRGIPMDFVPALLSLRSTHYDFEMDMLITCRETGRAIREIPISTIYLDDNNGSHFRPVLDSMRVYMIFLRFSGVSLLTAALDNLVFVAAMQFWPYIGLCQILSRMVAGTFQFWASKRRVFRSQAAVAPAMLRFWLLVAATGGSSYILMRELLNFTEIGPVPAKLIAESLMFFVSFAVQRSFVFVQSNGARERS